MQLLLLAAKVNFHSDRTEIKYSTSPLVKPTLDHQLHRLVPIRLAEAQHIHRADPDADAAADARTGGVVQHLE